MGKNKKVGIAVIIVIIFIILIFNANSKSNLIRQMQGPIEGTESVLTSGNNLIVISKNNHTFTWQWDNLRKWPMVAKPNAAFITPVFDNKIVYNLSNSGKLILTDLKAEKEISSSIRISISRYTTKKELEFVLEKLKKSVEKLSKWRF